LNLQIKSRLGLMMFLEYFVWGSWYVTISTWLSSSLHFTGEQVGIVGGATGVGAIVAPFFVGLVADRFVATEKVLGCLHLDGAGLLFAASRQNSFPLLYSLMLLYCLCFMPTIALTNSLSFRQMQDPKLEFGPIRVLGTAGWIVAGLFIGSLGLDATKHPVEIAAGCSLLMGLYCFSLPHTPPLAQGTKLSLGGLFPKEAVTLLKERSMAVFALASLLICIPLQFYFAFTNLYLNQSGVRGAAGKMTGGQFSELFCMLLIPWFFRRLGTKYMLVTGMFAWAARYALFAYGNAGPRLWMLWLGILIHGVCFDFFFVTGQIYIDRKASPALRAAAQGLMSLITYGLGMFVGSWVSGAVVEHYEHVGAGGALLYDWRPIWIWPSALSAIVLLGFLFTFSDKQEASQPVVGPAAGEELPGAVI
jgi:nucleoside transporter